MTPSDRLDMRRLDGNRKSRSNVAESIVAPWSLRLCDSLVLSFCLSWTISCVSFSQEILKPDLRIKSIEVAPEYPVAGLDYKVRVTVENVGNGDAEENSQLLKITVGDKIVDIPYDSIPRGGGTRGVVREFTAPPVAADFAVTAYADFSEKVIESDENNNRMAIIVVVRQEPVGRPIPPIDRRLISILDTIEPAAFDLQSNGSPYERTHDYFVVEDTDGAYLGNQGEEALQSVPGTGRSLYQYEERKALYKEFLNYLVSESERGVSGVRSGLAGR